MTLVEVMVALGILAAIGTIAVMTLSNTLQAREILSENDDHQQSVRVALDTITRELELAYLTYNTQVPNSYMTVFVARDESPIDTLWFASLSHQRLYRNSRESDQTEISIWAEDDPTMDGAYVLMHREAPRIDHEPDEGGVIYPLAYGVKRFTIRFLDSDTCEWADEWDSNSTEQSGRLPRAAQVVLGVMGPDPDDPDNEELIERSYATTVLLQYGKRARCDLFAGQGEEDQNVGAGTGPADGAAGGLTQ